MNSEYTLQIEKCTAYRKDRERNRNLALRNQDYLKAVVATAVNPDHKNQHQACWILELVCEKKLKTVLPYVSIFLDNVPQFKNDSAIRSASKICLFLTKSNHRANGISLTLHQETQLIEICFDWFIKDEKVATKVYCIKALFILNKKHPWIYEELHTILQQGYHTHSAAYKAIAKSILGKTVKKR